MKTLVEIILVSVISVNTLVTGRMLESPGHPELGVVDGWGCVCAVSAQEPSLQNPAPAREWRDPAGKHPTASDTYPLQAAKPLQEDGEASLAAINGFHSYKRKHGLHHTLSWGKKGGKISVLRYGQGYGHREAH